MTFTKQEKKEIRKLVRNHEIIKALNRTKPRKRWTPKFTEQELRDAAKPAQDFVDECNKEDYNIVYEHEEMER